MLKIDLLPGYVRERRAVRKYLIVAGFGLGGVFGGMFFWYTTKQSYLTQKKDKLQLATSKKSEVDVIRAQTKAEQDAAAPMKTMASFFREAKNFGPAIETLLREISRFSFNQVRIFSINPTDAPAGGGDPNAMGGDPNAMGMGMGAGAAGLGGLGGGGAAAPVGDIKAVVLDCWTNEFTNVKRFQRNLSRSGLFSAVLVTVPFQFQNTEGPSSGGGAGGMGGLGGGMGMGGMAGGGGTGGAPSAPSTSGASQLMVSPNGGTFQIVCVLVTPIKGVPVPGSALAADPNAGMMGGGAMDGSGMMGGGGGAPPAGPADDDGGGGGSKASKKEADGE